MSSVGKETLSYCTSCKMDLNHVIVALRGDRIAKVQCRTCKKEHAYKAAKGVSEPTKASKTKAASERSTGASAAVPVEVEWERLMSANKNVPFQPYSAKGNFQSGDRLRHPTFGDGIVGKLIYPNKLEVIFQNDVKVLIHGGPPATVQA